MLRSRRRHRILMCDVVRRVMEQISDVLVVE